MVSLFVVNQQEERIAVAEAKAAAFGWGWWKDTTQPVDGVLLLKTRRVPKHLGLVNAAARVLFSTTRAQLEQRLRAYPWRELRGKRYKVAAHGILSPDLKTLAGCVWEKAKGSSPPPKVDVNHPDVTIDLFPFDGVIHVMLRVFTNTEKFQDRRAHLRPELHPSSMHPAMARALVNLACAKRVHDPCAGTGGIVIEAALAGLHASGADIDPEMVRRARVNTRHYHLHPELRVADATLWSPRCGAIIADLPYGKSTKPVAILHLLEAMLHRASARRAIIGLHHPLPASFQAEGWKVRAHLTSRVHKSMTKHFYVLER
jgi:putative methyltransferase (TIGR01177 family)